MLESVRSAMAAQGEDAGGLLARVALIGTTPGVEQLTYRVPPAMTPRLTVGHRVLVPLRSRRVTGIVLEVSADLDTGGAEPRPLLELLEAQPLYDRAHLRLIEFLASYYMTPVGDAYRSLIPATARIESQRLYHPGEAPSPLREAALTMLERRVLAEIEKRPATLRQLKKLDGSVEGALRHLAHEGLIDEREATRGRHREASHQTAALTAHGAGAAWRGARQRALLEELRAARGDGLPVAALQDMGFSAMLRAAHRRGWIELKEAGPQREQPPIAGAAFALNPEQQAAIATVAPAIAARRFASYLLWGVTGSGKTEVYVLLATRALKAGRNVLVLTPEIELANQVVQTFTARFGATVAVVHSAQNVSERWAAWRAALCGAARIVIGPRSAIFAPLSDLGLIVVDEEHDAAYKQEEGIRYHARDLAVALGQFSECPVVLGSATPSAESYANARRGRYELLRLPQRVGGKTLAAVEVIDLRQAVKPAANVAQAEPSKNPTAAPPIAPALAAALTENFAAGGQSLVFLNRRGYHNFIQCHLCGNVVTCANCSVSLTFHLRDRTMRCHYCGLLEAAPNICAACGGFGLEGQGFGTERLTEALAAILPSARIARLDSDTRRGMRRAIVEELRAGKLDLVVGTQMITKGFDFPGVTLVGVLMADMSLNLPDFRSAERTFQLLTQVAGRAGRGDAPGRVLIQTYAPHHYSIRAAREQNYERFMRRELELRRELGYPPFMRMALVRIEGADADRVSATAHRAAHSIKANPETLRVLGPAPAPIERIKQRYRWQIMLKAQSLNELRSALRSMRAAAAPLEQSGVRLMIDIDPVNML